MPENVEARGTSGEAIELVVPIEQSGERLDRFRRGTASRDESHARSGAHRPRRVCRSMELGDESLPIESSRAKRSCSKFLRLRLRAFQPKKFLSPSCTKTRTSLS